MSVATTFETTIQEIGGEPLEGSGFETETPRPDFAIEPPFGEGDPAK